MMTTKINCRLNCMVCHLSGFRGLVVKLMQVSGGQEFLASPTTR